MAQSCFFFVLNFVLFCGTIYLYFQTQFNYKDLPEDGDSMDPDKCCPSELDGGCYQNVIFTQEDDDGDLWCSGPMWQSLAATGILFTYTIFILLSAPCQKTQAKSRALTGCAAGSLALLYGIFCLFYQIIWTSTEQDDMCQELTADDGSCTDGHYYLFGLVLAIAGFISLGHSDAIRKDMAKEEAK